MSLVPPPLKPPVVPKPPGRLRTAARVVASWPGRLSLPARAAWLLWLALVVVIFLVWLVFLTTPESVPWRFTLTMRRIVIVLTLTVLIPLVLYATLQMWLRGEVSPFPELDYAWNAGMQALERHGLSVQSVPVFLVLGAPGEHLERVLMDASKLSFRVRDVPEGPAPLHWYANPERIYLFCTEASWLSALSELIEKTAERRVSASGAAQRAEESFSMPLPSDVPQPSGGGAAHRGTMSLTQLVAPRGEAPAAAPKPEAPSPQPSSLRGTMLFHSPLAGVVPSTDPNASGRTVHDDRPAVLAPQDSMEQLDRLRYVCQLLRNARDPLCPANGVLVLMPLDVLQGSDAEAAELERAVEADLTTVLRGLQLRCPVTALVVGMEKEPGFRELVRRVGRERASEQRFGQRFDVRGLATAEEMSALAVHVCGVFEDWIYMLFREQGALTRPGNTRLYALLCKVRLQLQGRLSELLADGFGYDPQYESADDALLFSGCYFAATGDGEDKQAFVKGVLDKLEVEQEEIQWSPAALAVDRRHRVLTYTGLGLSVLFSLSLAGILMVLMSRS